MTMAIATPGSRPRASKSRVEHKTFVLEKAALDANGTISGYAAVFGNLDDGGDIIEPGFFADVIPDFLREGFVAAGHDWNLPIAIPLTAVEDDHGLFVTASYHSDAESQRYRTIASERIAAGKQVGLSIGYEIGPGGARIEKDGRHLIKAERLFEFSQVTAPMNRLAEATDVKTRNGKAAADNVWTATYVLNQVLSLIQDEAEMFDAADVQDDADMSTLGLIRDLVTQYIGSTAGDVGTPEDMAVVAAEEAARAENYYYDWGWMGRETAPFAQHAERVAADLKALAKRTGHLKARRKEGRVLSSANRTRLESLVESLAAAMGDIEDLLASTEAEKDMTPAEMELAFLETEARLAGHLN